MSMCKTWTLWIAVTAQQGAIRCAMPQLKESKVYSCLTGHLPKPDSDSNRAPMALCSWNYFCAIFQLSVLMSVSLNFTEIVIKTNKCEPHKEL